MDNPLDICFNSRCLIIGNGPSVLEHKKGHIIDAFDEIIRFNKFKIKGYEEYVGTKTTIYATFGKGQLPSDDDCRPERVLYVHGKSGNPSYTPAHIWRIPLSFYNELRKKIQSETFTDTPEKILPSSGVLVISWLLHNGFKSLYIHGFDNFDKEKSKLHHYWINKSYIKPPEHDSMWEKRYVEQLKSEEKILTI